MVDSSGQTAAGRELLATKLYKPKWRPGLVSRPRLIERLDQGLERKLTLVSAPPGFGKSTLLAEWLDSAAAKGRLAAWVSLDQGDNDPSLFWAYFIAAAQTVRSGIGESARSLLHSTQAPSIEQFLTTLINEINMIEEDLVLILDDYHLITDNSVHEGIGFLLGHLPPHMNLIITSRTDPPLPLSHLRGRGELTELRDSDLSFTLDEASAFLSQSMGIELTSGDVEALETRTEGWVAGLQLAALSMQGREDTPGFIEAFAGDDRYIVDYLAEEVLLRQPERVRDFLTQTCILDLLSGTLCDAVTSHEDGAEMLTELEQSNLFIIPLDDKRQWYRYHHLFQDFLKSSSVGPTAEAARELHLRAASWFENNGMAPEAIEHARTGGDHETVARLLVANFEEFRSHGQHASIAIWAASLPEEMVQLRPRLALVHAAGAMGSEDNNQNARKLASWAEKAISGIENSGGFDTKRDVNGTVVGSAGLGVLKGELLALQLRLTYRNLSPDEFTDMASQALDLLPRGHHMRGAMHLIDLGYQTARSDMKSSLPALEKNIGEARRARNSSFLAAALFQRGQINVSMGLLEEGRRSFEEAILLSKKTATGANMMLGALHNWLAEVLLERGDHAEAVIQSTEANELISDSPMRSPVLFIQATTAQIFAVVGNTEAAIASLGKAQTFVQGSSDSRFYSFLSSVNLKVYCSLGDLQLAADVVRERELTPDVEVTRDNEEEITAYARYLIAVGEFTGAEQACSNVLAVVQEAGHVQHEIHALVLHASANELLGKHPLALESIGRATSLGEPGRFNRSFTGEGPVVVGLVKALADAKRRSRGPAEAGTLPYLTYLLEESGVEPDTASTQAAAGDLVEPLTEREIEILRHIVAGMTNQDIAEQLVVSMSTVKTHINRTYRKLDVQSRTQAIARIRQLGIV